MPVPPNVRLPNFDHLPVCWTASDARVVLAALDASGLRPFEFARGTGLDPRRIWRARRSAAAVAKRTAVGNGGSVRLVELVASVQSPAKPSHIPVAIVEVVAPGGWQLRVPGALLADL